jgi:hypothetical protein
MTGVSSDQRYTSRRRALGYVARRRARMRSVNLGKNVRTSATTPISAKPKIGSAGLVFSHDRPRPLHPHPMLDGTRNATRHIQARGNHAASLAHLLAIGVPSAVDEWHGDRHAPPSASASSSRSTRSSRCSNPRPPPTMISASSNRVASFFTTNPLDRPDAGLDARSDLLGDRRERYAFVDAQRDVTRTQVPRPGARGRGAGGPGITSTVVCWAHLLALPQAVAPVSPIVRVPEVVVVGWEHGRPRAWAPRGEEPLAEIVG